jgi:hypothetical protein
MMKIMESYPTPPPPPAKPETLAKLATERARFTANARRPMPTTQAAALKELTDLRAVGNPESVGGEWVKKWLEES